LRQETTWEPPQAGDADGVVALEDEASLAEIDRAEKLAAILGLQCVGMMMTVPIQEAREGKVRLRARDVAQVGENSFKVVFYFQSQ
jgi:coenzyme F420-reducing hydrogenase beta subunit